MNDLLTASQLEWLRRLDEWGQARVSSRNSVEHRTISGATANAFAVRGLTCPVPAAGRLHHVQLSQAGQDALKANRGHLPPRPQDTAAYRRGRAAAIAVRTVALAELQAVANSTGTERGDVVGRQFARHQIDRLQMIADQENQT